MSRDLLVEHLNEAQSSWMCGRFGAVAEFHRDPGEPVVIDTSSLEAHTARGALRIEPSPELRPVAYETVSKCMTWGQGVALCLPDAAARMSARTAVTELGPDADAVRPQDRNAVLFDLGIGGRNAEICVRSDDPATIAALRAGCGRPLLGGDYVLLHRMHELSPHRVFRCRLGRVEVFQRIPPPDGKSPDGPHTHVRANLMALRRHHAATVPVPEGWFAGITLYPAHPLLRDHEDSHDAPVSGFDRARYEAFQDLLRRYGDPALLRGKEAAAESDLATRSERIGFRIGQRQRKWLQA